MVDRIKSHSLLILLLFTASLLLSGCGQTGALYFPKGQPGDRPAKHNSKQQKRDSKTAHASVQY